MQNNDYNETQKNLINNESEEKEKENLLSNCNINSSHQHNNLNTEELMQNSFTDKRCQKYKKVINNDYYEKDMMLKLVKILLKSCFYFLQHFQNKFTDYLIHYIIEFNVKKTDHVYDYVYQRILKYCKN